ncbi:unnamed protein product [Schistocephalus solidus]|uniref:Reverse transcriptase domain-containing protein n=1 Tax=Schistocephalus solidus TaxID=70667 RepID=A0A183TDW2_SCHSO|nr:unnamed protein product [Schistocephalus solidus]
MVGRKSTKRACQLVRFWTCATRQGLAEERKPLQYQLAPRSYRAAAYLDDTTVIGSSPDELLQRPETVLSRIQDYGFHLSLNKCNFSMPSVNYLGFLINRDGRHPDPDNINAIKQRPSSKDLISSGNATLFAFEEAKTMLSSDLLLIHFNPDLKIVVAADASNYGTGAVILHVFADNTEKAICNAARSLTSAERNYG